MNFYNKRYKNVRIVATIAVLSQQILLAPLSQSSQIFAQDGGVVVGGSANIVHNGTTVDITSQTDRTVINWDTFNINAGHTTNFYQPGVNSAVLNRVMTPNNPSAIFGNLNSNGNVYLVNPSGIVIGNSGLINTNGFTASVLDISNDEFMQGGVLNFRGNSNASVINQGRIYTGTGGTTLIGGEVINEGLIESNGGSINLLSGGSVTLKGGGIYTQADQETLLNGISETSGLIKNSGTLRATGSLEVGGEVYLVSPGGTVIQEAIVEASKKDANGDMQGGTVLVDAGEGTATVSGSIDVQGKNGGTVTVTGTRVELLNAQINASGENGGGLIQIGGGFQGQNESINNAQSTLIDAHSILKADATHTGNGGNVIIWSDGATDYFGSISNQGSAIGTGGFTEVSGKTSLNFAGLVNTGGGNLLLDPYNYTIDATAAGNILTALGSNNVTIQTSANVATHGSSGSNTDPGKIVVNADILWDSSNSLTMLAHRDIRFNASVQNRNATGGDLNIVAGWDGTTAFNLNNLVAADVSSTTLFGNNNGSVVIGDGTQASGIAVGSRSGNTNVFAYDVNLQAKIVGYATDGFAQLGFQVSDGIALGGYDLDPSSIDGANVIVDGGITVHALNDLTATSGGSLSYYGYSQIGHVGADRSSDTNVEATASSVIELTVGRDITFTAGAGSYTYSQLGQGGYSALGNYSGTTTITQANDVAFSAGTSSFAYTQLGQGGHDADGNHSGTIVILKANNISFSAGGLFAYAHLGQGGYFAKGNHSGQITIVDANDITFTSGSGTSSTAYVQLGSGGLIADGNHSGDITIIRVNNITFSGGNSGNAYAQVGNGGFIADGNHSGDITITRANNINFAAGNGGFAYAQLGHGGRSVTGNHSGAITISQANDISFVSGANFAYAQLGLGGYANRGDHSGTITITQAHDISFASSGGFLAYSQLGNGGASASGKHSGAIMILSSNDITFTAGVGTRAYSQLGHRGDGFGDDFSGAIDVTLDGNLFLTGENTTDQYALLGHGDDPGKRNYTDKVTGDVIVRVGGNATLTKAFVGHLIDSNGTYTSSNTYLGVRGDLTTDAGSQFFSAPSVNGGELRFYVTGNDLVDSATLLNGVAHGGTPFPNDQGSFGFGSGPYTPAAATNFAYYHLADLYNYDVDATAAGNIQIVLTGSDVTLASDLDQASFGASFDWDGGTQYININSDLLYNSPHSLTMQATGDINFNASVQNRNVNGGDLNIVAGWDGTTAFNLNNLVAADVTSTTLFGNNNGSVFIGDGNQVSGVAVGSRRGNTNVFAYDVNLQAGTGAGADGRFAQLGFQISDGVAPGGFDLDSTSTNGANVIVDGGITVHSINDVTATAGDTTGRNYVQIGHVGADKTTDNNVEAAASGMFEFLVGRNMVFTAGDDRSYAQLGNGGYEADGNHSSNITITRVDDLTFIGGTGFQAYAQLGNGGLGTDGNDSGAITITKANDIIFSGQGTLAYSQLGNGGYNADGNHTGVITVTKACDLIFSGGAGTSSFAQLGNGGLYADGNHSGSITIAKTNDIIFTGNGRFAYAHLGNGGSRSNYDHSGTLTIKQAHDLTFTAGAGDSAYVQLGQGGFDSDGNHSGTIDVTLAGHLSFTGQNVTDQYALLGHGDDPGDRDAGHSVSGDINLRVGGNVAVDYGWLGHLLDADGSSHSGSMTLMADGNIVLNNLLNSGSYDSADTYSYIAGGDVTFHSSVQNRNAIGGDLNIVAGWDGSTAFNLNNLVAADVSSTTLFGNNSGSVFIGDGTQASGVAVGSRRGNTNVFAYDVNLKGGTGTGAGATGRFAQLGFQISDGVALGGFDLDPTSADGANVIVDGGITVHSINDVTAIGGTDAYYNYVQIGHVGADQVEDNKVEAVADSLMEFTIGRDLIFMAGNGSNNAFAYAQLGQGGFSADGNHSGTIIITQAHDLIFTGGNNYGNSAHLGHGGYSAAGNHSGTITIMEANDLTFTAVVGRYAYAHLGHGGYDADGNHSGAILISKANDITFTAGDIFYAYAHLGHGGAMADGNHSGTISITQAHDLTFTAGAITGGRNYAQLGQGGYHATGNHSGVIDITLDGNLTLTGQDLTDQYALLGHGDDPGDGDAGYTVSGDINLRVGGNATFTKAFVGHLIDNDGSYASGNTFIGVRGDLTTDAGSQFFSAPTGALRFYIAGNDLVNSATRLNGMAHGGTPFPNNQGNYGFGDGPYNPTSGNFAYYTLADLFNYDVDATSAGNILTALASGNVTLASDLDQANFGAFYDWDGGTQFININSNLLYDSPHSLTMQATGDINFNASVQNRNAVGGDLNFVAGWNGSTAFNLNNLVAADVTSTTLFGNNNGSVFIGDGYQARGVAVGSRSGNTNVFAYDVNLQGGNGTGVDRRFAQLGFYVIDGRGLDGTYLGLPYRDGRNVVINGGMTLHSINAVTAKGGNGSNYNYAQIGHIGSDHAMDYLVDANTESLMELTAGGDVVFIGGAGEFSYAQFGHGGFYARGDFGGTTTVSKANNLIFKGGSGRNSYAQFGYGGWSSAGDFSGTTTITQVNDLIFTGGQGNSSYAQLGHGGIVANGNHNGTTTITQAHDLIFKGGKGRFAYAQLGQGGRGVSGGKNNGSMLIEQAHDLIFTGGKGWNAYAQLGQGGSNVLGTLNGTTTITQVHDLIFIGGRGRRAYAQLGQGGYLSSGVQNGTLTISQAHNLLFTGGNESSYALLGQGGMRIDGIEMGTTTITQVNNLIFTGGYGSTAYAQLGQGGSSARGSYSGAITITQAKDIIFTGGSGFSAYAHLGHGGAQTQEDHTGTITISQANDLVFSGGAGDYAYAQLGQGGRLARGNHSGTTTITQAHDIIFTGGAGDFAYAQLGQGGVFAEGNHRGSITITQANDITFTGGSNQYAYAQLGQGGFSAEGNHSGTTTITQAHDLIFSGGADLAAYAQLGQGGDRAIGNHSGAITITQANDLAFTGGAFSAYAQLGQGGTDATGNHSGLLTITQVHDITFTGGSDWVAYAQLGQGGFSVVGNHSGTTTITQAHDLIFTGGDNGSYAQLGQGGYSAAGNHSGTTTITQANNLTFTGGDGDGAYAQLGQGGYKAAGNRSGTIAITQVNDLTFTAGDRYAAYAQLGQGGYYAVGNHSGTIDVTLAGNLTLTGQDLVDQYVLLGHGDQPGESDAGRSVGGDVKILVGGSALLSNAYVGHLIDPDGTYASGKTYLAVGASDYSGANLTDRIVADGNTRFFSAATADGGELRFYLPAFDSFQVVDGALLNGVDVATFTGGLPNLHGGFQPFDGPYNINPADGNFAFYLALDIPERVDVENLSHDLFGRYQDYFNTIDNLIPPTGPGGINWIGVPGSQEEQDSEEPGQEGFIPFEIRINSLQASN